MSKAALLRLLHPVASLPLAAALLLGVELALRASNGAGLCPTESCAVVGGFSRIGEQGMVLLGAVFFALLGLAGMLRESIRERLGTTGAWLALALALSGAAFEGAAISYQTIGIGAPCALCLATAGALLLCLAAQAWERREWHIVLLGVAVFAGGFATNGLLRIAPEVPTLEETAMLVRPADAESQVKMHLFFSMHCEHCGTVIRTLAANEPWQAEWRISTLDRDEETLGRVAWILASDKARHNPFAAIAEAKGREDRLPVSKELRASAQRTATYLAAAGYHTVPILVADEGPGRRIVARGVENIMGYLHARGFVTTYVE